MLLSRRHSVVQKRSWQELVGFFVWCKRSLAHPNSLSWFRGCNHFTSRGFLFNSVLIFNREVTLWSFAHLCSRVQGVWDTGSCNKREVFGSLVATTGTMLSFPHSELAAIHRRLKKCGLPKSARGAIRARYSVRNEGRGINRSRQLGVSKSCPLVEVCRLYQVIWHHSYLWNIHMKLIH